MKKLISNKISVGIFVFGLLALIASGYNLVQAQEGQNESTEDTRTETGTMEDSKADYVQGYFDYYSFIHWPSGSKPLDPDYKRYTIGLFSYDSSGGTPRFQSTDINGDGLMDLIYYANNTSYGMFLNNGANELRPIYLCVDYNSGYPSYIQAWYGNCVDPSWVWTPTL